MNICFYTTDHPSVANQLNINNLITSRPGHNYSFLQLKIAPNPSKGFVDKLRTRYSEMRFNDGRFDFQRDLLQIRANLASQISPVHYTQFRQGYADEVNDEKSVQFIKTIQPDVIIQAGAGIMKPNTFSLARVGTINLHHGIMPEIRGIESTFWCMFFGIKDKIGVSCHFIDETIDTGAVIAQTALQSNGTSFIDIQTANYLMGRSVLVNAVDILDKGGYKVQSKGEVKSYYFGNVNPFLYYALKKRNFHPLMKISEKSFKMKELKALV